MKLSGQWLWYSGPVVAFDTERTPVRILTPMNREGGVSTVLYLMLEAENDFYSCVQTIEQLANAN